MTIITGYTVDAGDWQTAESRVGRSFNISLEFTPLRHNDEVTYLTMSEGFEDRKSHEDGWLASIPIRHPAGVIIDESNWAGFLHHNVFKLGNGKWEMPKAVAHKRGFTLLEAFQSLGRYCFRIERVGMSFGVVIDRPEGTSLVYQRYPTGLLIKHPFGDQVKYKSIQFSNEGIYVQSDLAMQGMSAEHDSYLAEFVSKLPPHRELQIHLDKKKPFTFKVNDFAEKPSNMLAELAAAIQKRRYRKIKGLVPKSFRGFEYFRSVDGGILLTLQNDPVTTAFVAIKEAMDDVNEADGFNERTLEAETRYRWVMAEYVLGDSGPDNDRETLRRCIEIMESLELKLPKSPLPDHPPEM